MRTVTGLFRFVGSWVLSIFFGATAILLLPVNPRGISFHANSRLWARAILGLCGVRVSVRGLEYLKGCNYVYVCNHASMFDIPAIVATVPDQIRIVYKKELERIPIFGWGLKWGSYIGIDRGRSVEAMRSLEEAAQIIRDGASVLLYAEGTRTTDGKLQPFKRGAFNLAVRAGVPVIPLTINGSFGILRKHSFVIRPGNVEVVLDAPIDVPVGGGKDAEMDLMDKVHAAMEKNYVEQS